LRALVAPATGSVVARGAAVLAACALVALVLALPHPVLGR
jgi:HAMP domain-containing protein